MASVVTGGRVRPLDVVVEVDDVVEVVGVGGVSGTQGSTQNTFVLWPPP